MTTKHVPIQIWNKLKKIRNKKDILTGKRITRQQIQEILLNKYGYKVSLRTIERRLPLKIDEQLDIEMSKKTLSSINMSLKGINDNLFFISYQLYMFMEPDRECKTIDDFNRTYLNLMHYFDE